MGMDEAERTAARLGKQARLSLRIQEILAELKVISAHLENLSKAMDKPTMWNPWEESQTEDGESASGNK